VPVAREGEIRLFGGPPPARDAFSVRDGPAAAAGLSGTAHREGKATVPVAAEVVLLWIAQRVQVVSHTPRVAGLGTVTDAA
jgi:hypothetical protein